MLRQYFSKETNDLVFPPHYEAVSDYATILKNQIIHNEEMLVAESARKNDLIAYLAHDLKTPLTSIISYTELLSGVADDVRAEHGKSLNELFKEVFRCYAN